MGQITPIYLYRLGKTTGDLISCKADMINWDKFSLLYISTTLIPQYNSKNLSYPPMYFSLSF